MSDAERSGGPRERLDWGDAREPSHTPATTDADELTDAGRTAADGPTDSDRTDADEPMDSGRTDADGSDAETDPNAELCSVEDPTCDACQ